MSSKYTYSITDFPNDKVAVDKLTSEIADSDITIALDYISSTATECDVWFMVDISPTEHTTLSGIVDVHDGEPLLENTVADVKIVDRDTSVTDNVAITGIPFDRSGKLRVHQTSRKLGTRIMWMGLGDDSTDINKVGGGESLSISHTISGTDPQIKYIDFNIANNETWLHEGYLTWKNANLDTLTLEMVPRTVTISGSTGTNYNVYNGYLVIPAAGDGYTELLSDITQPTGGLIYMPDNDLGEAPQAFWDADFNSSTGLYENITAAPYGNGRYNMFSVEIVFARFINTIPLLASGFIALNSSDTDQMGQGMRLKMIANTNTDPDRDWSVACIMCLHRNSSV